MGGEQPTESLSEDRAQQGLTPALQPLTSPHLIPHLPGNKNQEQNFMFGRVKRIWANTLKRELPHVAWGGPERILISGQQGSSFYYLVIQTPFPGLLLESVSDCGFSGLRSSLMVTVKVPWDGKQNWFSLVLCVLLLHLQTSWELCPGAGPFSF